MKNAVLFLLAAAGFFFTTACGPKAVHEAKTDRSRYQWYLDTSAGDYLKVGSNNPAWDKPVLRAFTNMAIMRVYGDITNVGLFSWESLINEAITAGCNDPLVQYWKLRGEANLANLTPAQRAVEWTNVAYNLESSTYSEIRKFYVTANASRAIRTSGTNSAYGFQLLISAVGHAEMVIDNAATPPDEAMIVSLEALDLVDRNPQAMDYFMDRAQPVLLRNWPDQWQRHQLEGVFEIKRAWLARGSDVAANTSPEAFAGFAEHLAKAEKALEKAWSLTPNEATAAKMITIELGQSRGRDRMEQWFDRAMRLNPNSWAAVQAKYTYLLPQWHGDDDELLQFARECVASTNWGGRTPLIMMDVHDLRAWRVPARRNEYYLQPGVWEDIHAAYEKFFKLNPYAQSYRNNYFWFAHACRQWPEAKEQLEQMGTEINYAYFGGETRFKEMVAEVRSH